MLLCSIYDQFSGIVYTCRSKKVEAVLWCSKSTSIFVPAESLASAISHLETEENARF